MEEESHRKALEEAARLKAKGRRVDMYTGGKGMKILLNDNQGEGDGEEEEEEVWKQGGDGQDDEEGVDEMGDDYFK